MGGRGGSSGMSNVSSEQRRLMNNLVKRNTREDYISEGFSKPKFNENKMVQ